MKILIPMAGKGDRFKQSGYETPKPMILVEGKPMIQHVVQRFDPEDEFIFAVNQDHLDDGRLVSFLEGVAENVQVLPVAYQPEGAVAVTKLLVDCVDDEEPVIVNYCDYSWGWNYKDFLQVMNSSQCDAGLVCYRGFHPNLLGSKSHATALEKGMIAYAVREKHSFTGNSFADWTSSGTHFFRRAELLKAYCDKIIGEEKLAINGEYYVAHVFQQMCEDQRLVRIHEIPYFLQWGTPEEYEEYVHWSEHFLKGAALPESYGLHDPRIYDYWRGYFSSEFHIS